MNQFRSWSPDEIEAIRTLPAGGIAELARRLGRSRYAILSMRHRRGFATRLPRWTDAERETLDRMVAAGATVSDAAAALGKARDAAYLRRRRARRRGVEVPALTWNNRAYRSHEAG